MEYKIHSREPINSSCYCFSCLVETDKQIYIDVANNEGFTLLSLIGSFTPLDSLKHANNSVKVPFCKRCKKVLNKYRLIVLFYALICIGVILVGSRYQMSDFQDYCIIGGALSLMFAPFLHLIFKESIIRVKIQKDISGYTYTFYDEIIANTVKFCIDNETTGKT